MHHSSTSNVDLILSIISPRLHFELLVAMIRGKIRGKPKEVNISYNFSKLYLETVGNPVKLCLKGNGDFFCPKIFLFLDNRS